MNLLLLPEASERFTLSARDARLEHIRGVLRVQVGDQLDVGAVYGPRGKGTVTSITPTSVELELTWGETPPPPPPVDLLVGLPRPNTAKKILQDATTLGVRRIIFVQTGKCDPAYARSSLWSSGEYREHLRLGAEQAFTTHLPEVGVFTDWDEALATLAPDSARWALDVYEATGALSTVPLNSRSVTLALGPERGWNAPDRKTLRDTGFILLSLGSRVLREETAVVAALALVLAKLEVM
ncbi:MAG: RsmE family RNA methyltransferase [Verrucomicrobiota bacterium JB022]|nr:RsmE family RNA methyltransferase [Verrucomicrobiota bacterium JB022]